MKTFGELIRDGRKQAGLTQRELSARIMLEKGRPMSAAYLEDIEHNLRMPSMRIGSLFLDFPRVKYHIWQKEGSMGVNAG